jgi:hypothetical protein
MLLLASRLGRQARSMSRGEPTLQDVGVSASLAAGLDRLLMAQFLQAAAHAASAAAGNAHSVNYIADASPRDRGSWTRSRERGL